MEWVCMLIGLFVGFLFGALSMASRQESGGMDKLMNDALSQLHAGQSAYFHISVGRCSDDDGGEDDVIPDPVLSSDRWRDN